eukprot:CAMPEP_0113689234 /NCGR_PEP_ID=MMETSP0038_2-20120614/17029_1 /TAXON_ID=2898 /ORGANISM="Cryptomonas paramecium" /LENGTH=346 /DNA_ID=CAMNT_0000610239 /DNA_START=270 /DNA_END=1307 /DNA_ORIENTATION=- /assembly_acc=CAM_ASM_000170
MTSKKIKVLDSGALSSLNALPLAIHIIDYNPPVRNVWANSKCLEVHGITLDVFCALDVAAKATEVEQNQWRYRLDAVQKGGEMLLERSVIPNLLHKNKQILVDTAFSPVRLVRSRAPGSAASQEEDPVVVMVTQWPLEIKSKLEANTMYMTSLLECSPYPLCFFTFDGHLITCNPAAVAVFGKTIWLQSDIFGMGERERRGLNASADFRLAGSFRIERTERRTAYENMMDALDRDGATFSVDLPIRRKTEEDGETTWYCRVFAQRHKDPISGEPIIMISHQDVTNLRKVEGELGRMEMAEHANKELIKQHDSDVAGSLLMLLGEDFTGLPFSRDSAGGGLLDGGRD